MNIRLTRPLARTSPGSAPDQLGRVANSTLEWPIPSDHSDPELTTRREN